jgi:8-oxo-dGTP diphosphatase
VEPLDDARAAAFVDACARHPAAREPDGLGLRWSGGPGAGCEALVRAGAWPGDPVAWASRRVPGARASDDPVPLRIRAAPLPDDLPFRTLADVGEPGALPGSLQTLCFVVRDGAVLLIEKRRGHGAGGVNGPGGKAEPGEDAHACAVRETLEEVRIRVHDAEPAGRILFQYAHGPAIDGHVFRATRWTGTPAETAEARPFWASFDRIPWARLWDDDVLWLPLLLRGERFTARLLIHRDRLVAHRVRLGPGG